MEESELEEERRLAYVGITRAEEALYLTNAFSRTLYGRTQYNRPSRFVEEIDQELLEIEGMRPTPKKRLYSLKKQHIAINSQRQRLFPKSATGGENNSWKPEIKSNTKMGSRNSRPSKRDVEGSRTRCGFPKSRSKTSFGCLCAN